MSTTTTRCAFHQPELAQVLVIPGVICSMATCYACQETGTTYSPDHTILRRHLCFECYAATRPDLEFCFVCRPKLKGAIVQVLEYFEIPIEKQNYLSKR